MPKAYLCNHCLELHLNAQEAHAALRPVIDIGDRWLFRCSECGAFATPSGPDGEWSLNILGQRVSPPDEH